MRFNDYVQINSKHYSGYNNNFQQLAKITNVRLW